MHGGVLDARHATMFDVGSSSLLTKGKIEIMVAAIQSVLCDEGENSIAVEAKTRNARELVVNDHTVDKMAAGYWEVIQRVIARGPAERGAAAVGGRRRRTVEAVQAVVSRGYEKMVFSSVGKKNV